MNGGPLRVIIGIVVLAIIVSIIIFVIQRTVVKQVRDLQTKKQKLIELDTKMGLVDGKKLSLTGQALKKFDDLQKKYQKIEQTEFITFDQMAEDVLFEAKGWNFIHSRQSLNALTNKLDVVAEQIVSIRKGITDLQAMDSEHRQAVKKLESEYQSLRKTLLTRNFEFGDAIDKLEEILAGLEDDFDEFTKLTEQGDHTAAADIYTQLKQETEALEKTISEIPAIQKQVGVDFPAQIKEIQAAFMQLTTDGYIFPNKRLQTDIASVEASRVITSNLITELKIADASANVTLISKQIENLYAQMETEIKAKKNVTKATKRVEQFINHERHQNHLLMIELDRIGQRYILTEKQEQKTQRFAEEIKQVETDYRQTVLDVQFDKAIFSVIEKQYTVFEDKLTDIELKQQAIWNDLQQLSVKEKQIVSEVEAIAFELRDTKREVEQWNLPGLPETYKKMYQSLNNKIDRLDRTLQASHVNMLEIEQNAADMHEEMQLLRTATEKLYADSQLAEQLFQLANRYKNNHKIVADAYNEALNAYQNYFDFAYAQKVLGEALDQVEPGTYDKIKTQS